MNFIKNNWNFIIKAGFVFQLNPLLCIYKPLVLHIIPSTNGKANIHIVEMLYNIRKILHDYRIEVVSFTFDSDNAYTEINDLFFQSYISKLLKTNIFFTGRVMMVRISPDLGHIVKRLRYRLLSCNVHMNFEEDPPFIDIQHIPIALPHVPEIVFCNSKMTKMHDSLPMSLFTLHNFLILFDMKMFIAAAYFFLLF